MTEALMSDLLFKEILVFVCLCFGQDEDEFVPKSIWAKLFDVLNLILGRKRGRQGELVLREILEGKVSSDSRAQKLRVPEADRKTVRGAVM